MAETDSTRSTASTGHGPDHDGTAPRPSAPGAEDAVRDDATASDGAEPPTRMIPAVQDGPTGHGTGSHPDGSEADPEAHGPEAAGGTAGDDAPGTPSGAHPFRGADRTPEDGSRATPAAGEPSTDTAALSVRPTDTEAARRAAVRDQAVAAKPALARFLQVVVALFFPVIVVAAAVRAVASSSFLWLEYHRPGFPADAYGFSLDDRMTYGSYALDYVLNFAPARYLGGLVTADGEPLFLESEVGHMADVKGVLGLSFFVALVLFVLAVLACVYLARRYRGGIRRALFSGAVLTLVGIAVLTVLAVLAWQTFFTQVHALFFADGSWTFRVDDTLIRLFPEQFWTDSALTVAVLVLAATVLTLVLTWPTKARRERSMLAQDALRSRYQDALDAS
ncbi:TIGR01906 family membrane protein [Arthrobacter sp. MDT1-48-3]